MGEPALKKDRIYTYGDYRNWPDDERWELIEGTAWNMSPAAWLSSPDHSRVVGRPSAAPSRWHQQYSIEIARQISNFLIDDPCQVFTAPFDVLLPTFGETEEDDVTTVVQPDISVICDESKLTDKGCTGAPDWIIEILSPYTSRKDIAIKFDLYQRHGVREYWIVDPAAKYVHVYVLNEKGKYPEDPVVFLRDGVIECTVLDGLIIDLQRVFVG